MAFNEAAPEKLQAEKKQMRNAVLARRDAMLPSARATASHAIIEKLCALPGYRHAKVVLTYMGFGSEIETRSFVERILVDGKIVVLPRVDRASRSLILHAVQSLSELEVSKWGIREPRADTPSVPLSSIEFVLLPGVAFDRAGNRLGYGRGYYDKLLLAAEPALERVAAGFSCQIVDAVPLGPLDQKIDILITENEIINISHDR